MASPSTSHGTLVSRATWFVTAPATPMQVAAIERGVDLPGPEELAQHRLETVVVERDELADLDRRRSLRAWSEEPEQGLGTADVAGEQHGRGLYDERVRPFMSRRRVIRVG